MQTWNQAFIAWAAGKPRPWLAYKIGVSEVSIHLYLRKGTLPYRKRREAIERLSGGAVRADLPKLSHASTLNSNKSSRKRRARSVQNARSSSSGASS